MTTIAELLAGALKQHQAGQYQAAQLGYAGVLALAPDHADALHLQGVLSGNRGDYELAVANIERAIAIDGGQPAYHNNLGNILLKSGRRDEAIDCYRRALALKPLFAEASSNLGDVLFAQGELAEAAACYRRVLEANPDDTRTLNSLGNVLQRQLLLGEAIECYRQALHLNPDTAEICCNLGGALKEQGSLDEALAWSRRAVQLKPDAVEFHNNLGNVWKDQGALDEAVERYRKAVELAPSAADIHSNLVYTLNFCDRCDARAIYDEARRWNERHAAALWQRDKLHANDRTPDRRLRIGYVSPDFRWHPIGRFMLPLLESHDHDAFEIYCYASQSASDWLTERCRSHVDHWLRVDVFTDEQLADRIRQDKIDILVDLSMHMANNRLLVFARKPAPVQATYLAYPGTTGLEAIDYRVTDPYLDPWGEATLQSYSEQSIWLPETYWCYMPVEGAPPESSLPSLRTEAVTFGCLNNFCKVTDATLETWVRLLQATPDSRLLLHAHAGSHRDRVAKLFAKNGLSCERLQFIGKLPMADYLALYEKIDIALDPFPYGGGTTTCDALWMGVPVVTLAGQSAVERSGFSILSNLGLAELVAHDRRQYVGIASHLASDRRRLAALRATLRQRMESSPLMDRAQFARNIEAAYREMWQRWCISLSEIEQVGDERENG